MKKGVELPYAVPVMQNRVAGIVPRYIISGTFDAIGLFRDVHGCGTVGWFTVVEQKYVCNFGAKYKNHLCDR